MPLLACPAVFFREKSPALLDKPAVAPFFNGLLASGKAQVPRSISRESTDGGITKCDQNH